MAQRTRRQLLSATPSPPSPPRRGPGGAEGAERSEGDPSGARPPPWWTPFWDWALPLAGIRLGPFGRLHPVARPGQLHDHTVMYQAIDRRRRRHRILEYLLPLGER